MKATVGGFSSAEQLAHPTNPEPGQASPAVFSPRDRRIFLWVAGILFATVFEGAVRKWLAPVSLSSLIYGAKGMLALAFIIREPIMESFDLPLSFRRTVFLMGAVLIPPLLIGVFKFPDGALLTLKNGLLWPLAS